MLNSKKGISGKLIVISIFENFKIKFFVKEKDYRHFCVTAASIFVSDSTDAFDDNHLKSKNDINSWHTNENEQKSLKSSNLSNNASEEKSEKQLKKDKDSSTNSSTLSLHIAAYENSVEAQNIDKEADDKLSTNKNSTFEKAWKNVKQVLTGTFSMAFFEIPRQQENQTSESEVMQFRASQKLLNPNETDSSRKNNIGKSMSNETVAATDYISRACLGRMAQIGDIYDAITEQLIPGANIFKEKLPSDIITVTSNPPSISSEVISSNKVSDKLAALNVSDELSVSLLAGLIQGSGAIECINEKTNAKDSVQCTFIQKIRTIDEKITFNPAQMKHLIGTNIGEFGGTHVVVGISWGSTAAVTMTYKNENDESKMKLAEYQLKYVFEKFKELSIKDSGSEFENDNNFIDGLTVNVYADMIPTEFKLPSKLKEVKEYFKRMAQNFENVKGKQMELHLLPLHVVQQIFGLQSVGNQTLVNIEMPTVKRLKQLFDSIFEASATFQNLIKFVSENEEFIAAEDIDVIKNYANKFEVAVNELRGELTVLVEKVRSGTVETFEIEFLLRMFEKNPIASSPQLINSCKYLNEKLCFIHECEQYDVLTVTETSQIENIKHDFKDSEIFLMLCSFKNDRSLPQWTETKEFFFGLQNPLRTKMLAVVDTDVLPNIAKNESIPDGIRVAQYYNGECITNDYMEFQKKMDSQNTVACDNMQPNDETNIKGVPINFPCPKCSNGPKEWVCANCRQEIEYNFDGHFYCGCGFNAVEEFAFKCSDPMHGNDYVKFPENSLKQLIENIKPLQEVNILVIGETGVGKSTWINALANYISYDTMEDVLSNDFINLIPTQFELTEKQPNGELVQKSIKVGTSKNERFAEGQSATQYAKAYTFRHYNCLYRIIDTPGIGDSRGIEQDKKNMENIMEFISMYKEIHGICVLMRPNESRLTPSFEFCFKELLVQFHRSAVENIVFCFTQTSGFNFEVGQTLTSLTLLLDEIEKKQKIKIPKTDERMYAFDNMAYRYICAVKHSDFEFPLDQQELYKRSFDISRDVSRKMLNYFLDRKAHTVEESMSVYQARKIIRRLTHPMAMINTAVEETLEKVKDKQRLIQKFSNDEEELREILIKQIPFKRWYIEVYNQYYCETCETFEYYYDDDRLQFLEVNPSVMERNPYVLSTPTHYLTRKKSRCPQCGPNTHKVLWKSWLSSETGTREEEDITVAGQMKEKLKTKEGIEEEIKKVQRLKNELIAENDAIVKASARFAHFLATNSITPYNDATEKYLKLLIQKEERMGTDSKKVLYENLLSQYDAEKIALEKLKNASKFQDSTIKSSDIMETVEKLKKLKHYGRDIAQALVECNKAILYEASDEETEVCLPNQKMSKLRILFSRAVKFVQSS